MTPVKSSNIAAVGYDDATNTLRIRFSNGSEWDYVSVPKSIYESLLHAKSVGSYFAANIRGHYTGRRP